MMRRMAIFLFVAVLLAASGLVASASGAGAASKPHTPSAPSIVMVASGNGSLTVSWSAPLSGAPILEYAVKPVAKRGCTTTGALSCTVTQLKNKHTYNIAVRALNSFGWGPYSGKVSAETGLPGAPTITSATSGLGSATIAWSAAAANGNPVTGYVITPSVGSPISVGAVTSHTITGLTNGDSYTFTVKAINIVGTGPASAPSSRLVPGAVPGVPTAVTAGGEVVSGSPSAVVSFTAPAATGTPPLTGYTVVVYDTTAPTVTLDPAPLGAATVGTTPGSGFTVTGLNANDVYEFSVVASNAVGNGNLAPFVGPTPVAPTAVAGSSNGDGTADVSWTPSTVTFGTTITGFAVSSLDLTALALGPSASGGPGSTSTTLSGLTIGDEYDVCVRAVNSNGTGENTTCSEFVETGSVPSAPIDVSAAGEIVSGSPGVFVSFTAPTSAGSAPLTGYTVVVDDTTTATVAAVAAPLTAATVGSTPGAGVTIQSLNPDDTYSFSVIATNAVGNSLPSTSTGPTPVAPSTVQGTSNGDGTAGVSWTPSTVTFGTTTTGYSLASFDLTALTLGPSGSGGPGSTSTTLSGLTIGDEYDVCIRAINPNGTGQNETCSEFVESGSVPSAPVAVSAAGEVVSGSPSVVVSFTAPTSVGSSPLTGYTVVVDDTTTATVADVAAPLTAATVGSTPGTGVTVGSLNPDDTYSFSVVATNSVGNSPPSTSTGPTPVAPTAVQGTSNGNGTASVSWTPSTVTFGTTITGFSLSTLDFTTFTLGPSGSGGPGSTSTTLSGLTVGHTYDVCVRAANSFGTGSNATCSLFTE
jgi:hypothetical protein